MLVIGNRPGSVVVEESNLRDAQSQPFDKRLHALSPKISRIIQSTVFLLRLLGR